MMEQTTPKPTKPQKSASEKGTPFGRMTMAEVDLALVECDKTIKTHSDVVKAKLSTNGSLPTNSLRELSRANGQKAKLTMRRIALLIESGDAAAADAIEKLLKIKPAKVS